LRVDLLCLSLESQEDLSGHFRVRMPPFRHWLRGHNILTLLLVSVSKKTVDEIEVYEDFQELKIFVVTTTGFFAVGRLIFFVGSDGLTFTYQFHDLELII